jgi:NADH-quinone oxidoreductase subunit M
MGILSQLIFIPVLGMIVVMFIPKQNKWAVRWTATFFSAVPCVQSLWLIWDYYYNYSGTHLMAYVEGPLNWVPSLSVQYYLGVDGISVPMLALTGLLSLISVVASFNIENRVKEYFAFFLLLKPA